jgi:hypothetical protein
MTQRALPCRGPGPGPYRGFPRNGGVLRAPSWAEDIVAFIDAGEEDTAEVDRPDPVPDLPSPRTCCLSEFAMKSRRFLKRIVPTFVTRSGM